MSGEDATPGPVRVLSDLHLGHPASRIKDTAVLRPLLEGAGTVIFNGDTLEQSFAGWRPDADAREEELLALCRELEVRAVFLTGNHDPKISELGWLDLGPVFVSHGDMIFPTSAPWSWEYLYNKEKVHQIVEERRSDGGDLGYRYETTQQLHVAMVPVIGPQRSGSGWKYLLSALWPPERSFNMLRVWATMVGEAERFAKRYRPESRAFLYGHFHKPGVWTRGGRVHVNTGSFMHGMKAMVAELQEGALSVKRVEERGGVFVAGKTVGTFEVR